MTTLDAFRASHTFNVPSAHRESTMFPSRANATDVMLSPGACALLNVVFGRDANDQWLSRWHCALGGSTNPTRAFR